MEKKTFRPINRRSKPLPVLVAEQIADHIEKGIYTSGDRLAGEHELANQFGVGRSTLREAVKILVSKNILEIRRGSGIYVCQRTGISDDPLGFRFIENKKRLPLDLYEARMAFDPPIARVAALKATDEDIVNIQKICDLCANKILAGIGYVQEDIDFHNAIAQSTHNTLFLGIAPILNGSTPVFVEITPLESRVITITSHQAIVDAISRRDPEGAFQAATTHLLLNAPHVNAFLETLGIEDKL